MDIYYTKNHEWVKVEQNTAFVGITEYAASQLGDIVFIKLPDLKQHKQDETLGEIESVKAASEVASPLSAKVVAVNSKLNNNPEIINNSPQDEGWIAKVELTRPEELKGLMDEDKYHQYIQTLD